MLFWNYLTFFYVPTDADNLISGSSAFSKSRLNILSSHTLEFWLWEFWAILCWHVKWVQLCSHLNILCHCPSLGLEWKLTFSSAVATAEFSKFAGILSAALSQHHLLGFKVDCLEFHHVQYLWCFLRPTWLHIPGCLALGDWSHHCDYLGH